MTKSVSRRSGSKYKILTILTLRKYSLILMPLLKLRRKLSSHTCILGQDCSLVVRQLKPHLPILRHWNATNAIDQGVKITERGSIWEGASFLTVITSLHSKPNVVQLNLEEAYTGGGCNPQEYLAHQCYVQPYSR